MRKATMLLLVLAADGCILVAAAPKPAVQLRTVNQVIDR
jgi:hypothetical protein